MTYKIIQTFRIWNNHWNEQISAPHTNYVEVIHKGDLISFDPDTGMQRDPDKNTPCIHIDNLLLVDLECLEVFNAL